MNVDSTLARLFERAKRRDRDAALVHVLAAPGPETAPEWLRPAEALLTSARARLRSINPWHEWTNPDVSSDWSTPQSSIEHVSSVTKELEAEFVATLSVRFVLWGAVRQPLLQQIEQAHDAKEISAPFAARDVARARRQLHELVARPFSVGNELAWIPFALRAAAEAPLCCLERCEPDTFDVVANLSAGHLLRIHALRFPLESATPLVSKAWRDGRDHWLLDGGDLVVLLEKSHCDLLEGTASPARAKRRQELQSTPYDDDDDDGDGTSDAGPDDPMCDEYGYDNDD